MTHPLHEKAVGLAKTYRSCEPLLLETLMLMAEENLFIKMGFTGMWEYLVKELKLSECQASYFQRVAQRARGVAPLKEVVLTGRISLSQARRIVGVIEVESAEKWITLASTLKQRELEKEIKKASPQRGVREGLTSLAEDTVKLTALLSDAEEKLIERAQNLISQEQQRPVTLGEALVAMAELYLEKKDPVKKAERAASRLSQTPVARPAVVFPFRRAGRRPIEAYIKHSVHLRDGFRCTHTDSSGNRCEAQRFLQLHHIIPVSEGGRNTAENLTTICWAHHRGHHLQGRSQQAHVIWDAC